MITKVLLCNYNIYVTYYIYYAQICHTSMSLLHLEDACHGLPLAAVTVCPFTTTVSSTGHIGKSRRNLYWEFDGGVGRCQQRAGKQQLSFAVVLTEGQQQGGRRVYESVRCSLCQSWRPSGWCVASCTSCGCSNEVKFPGAG